MTARVSIVASDADILRISTENPGWRVEREAGGAVFVDPYRKVVWTDGEPPAEFDLDFAQLF